MAKSVMAWDQTKRFHQNPAWTSGSCQVLLTVSHSENLCTRPMIESSYFRRRKFEMKGCYLEKWLIPSSVLIALFSSNLSAAQVVGDTTLPQGERSLVHGQSEFSD